MKKYSHAWLAFMAIKRLEDRLKNKIEDKDEDEKKKLTNDELKYVGNLIKFFKDHKDAVIEGAWYPDTLIGENANEHVFKYAPVNLAKKDSESTPPERRKLLPEEYLVFQNVDFPLKQMAFNRDDPKDNLPDRCESLTEAVIDQLKIQQHQDKGSPVSPTDNQVALWLFMLSHYIADAHVPLHCDFRQFSKGADIHNEMEKAWDDEIRKFYIIDEKNNRFLYDTDEFPIQKEDENSKAAYKTSFLKEVEEEIGKKRKFSYDYGKGNTHTWDFMKAICQYSYLLSFRFLRPDRTEKNVTKNDWTTFASPALSFKQFSVIVLADAVDSIARVWFRTWRRYDAWVDAQEAARKKKEEEKKKKEAGKIIQPVTP
jgi:hypothetical protein